MGTLVYRYGLLAPIDNAEVVEQQFRAGHEYMNQLVEIERTRRAALRGALEAHPDVQAALTCLRAAQTALEAATARAQDTEDVRRARSELAKAERQAKAAKKASAAGTSDAREAAKAAAAVRRAAAKAYSDARRLARSAERSAEVRQARQAVKEARAAFAAARASVAVAYDEAERRSKDATKAARAASPAYWGTRGLYEAAVEQVRRDAGALYDGTEGKDPRFRRWSGEGRLAVQIQVQAEKTPMTAEELFGTGRSLVRIIRQPRVARDRWLAMKAAISATSSPEEARRLRAERAACSEAILAMRVASTETGAPVWARWPMKYHRPIPPGAHIKGATVHRTKTGPRVDWSVTFTVVTDIRETEPAPHEAVAVDLGWRLVAGGLRVAYAKGTDDREFELVLPHERTREAPRARRRGRREVSPLLAAIDHANRLHARRVNAFNLQRARTAEWLAAHADVPEAICTAARTISDWRSPSRLAHLVRVWRDTRFDGDAEEYEALAAWEKQDRHLWAWKTAQVARAHRLRREMYRVFAADLARVYGAVVVEDFDLRRVATRTLPGLLGEREHENETARGNRVQAAVSELRDALLHAFAVRGRQAALVAAVHTTKRCSACGQVDVFDAEAYVMHACSKCGAVWDQDANACANLIERWRDDVAAGTVRIARKFAPLNEKAVGRFQKRAAEKREREAAE